MFVIFPQLSLAKQYHQENPFSSYGITSVLVGPEKLGGDPWGIKTYDSEIYFTSLDQGYLAKLENVKIIHLLADLNKPMVFDFDPQGIIYLPEYGANRIIVFDPKRETITTLLDDVVKNPMAVRYYNGYLYVVDTGHHRILEVDPQTGDYDIIIDTGLYFPIDLDLHEDVIVIADGMNNLLQAINLSDKPLVIAGITLRPGHLTPIVGSGPPCPNAKDSLSPCNTYYSGDGGKALDAEINWPFAPRFDSRGRIWFIDANNNRLRMVDSNGTIYTFGGNAPLPQSRGLTSPRPIIENRSALETDFNRPMDMYLIEHSPNDLDILVSNTDNQVITLISGIKLYQ